MLRQAHSIKLVFSDTIFYVEGLVGFLVSFVLQIELQKYFVGGF